MTSLSKFYTHWYGFPPAECTYTYSGSDLSKGNACFVCTSHTSPGKRLIWWHVIENDQTKHQ